MRVYSRRVCCIADRFIYSSLTEAFSVKDFFCAVWYMLPIDRKGKYRVLPVSCEILSDICTPIEALRILKNAPEYIGEYVKSMKDAMKQNNV